MYMHFSFIIVYWIWSAFFDRKSSEISKPYIFSMLAEFMPFTFAYFSSDYIWKKKLQKFQIRMLQIDHQIPFPHEICSLFVLCICLCSRLNSWAGYELYLCELVWNWLMKIPGNKLEWITPFRHRPNILSKRLISSTFHESLAALYKIDKL